MIKARLQAMKRLHKIAYKELDEGHSRVKALQAVKAKQVSGKIEIWKIYQAIFKELATQSDSLIPVREDSIRSNEPLLTAHLKPTSEAFELVLAVSISR